MRTRKFSDDEIVRILKKLTSGATISDVANEYEVTPQTVYRWKKLFGDNVKQKPSTPSSVREKSVSKSKNSRYVDSATRVRELNAENEKLKRLLGEYVLENLRLKESVLS